MSIITGIFASLLTFLVGILIGINICQGNTKKAVETEMHRVCEVCKYKNLQGDDYDNNSREV